MNVKTQLIDGIKEFDSLFLEFLDRLQYPFRKSRLQGFTKNANNENVNNLGFNTTRKSSFTLNPFRKGTLKRVAESNTEERTRKTCIQTVWNKLQDISYIRMQLGNFYQNLYNPSIDKTNVDERLNYHNSQYTFANMNVSKSTYLNFLDQYAEFVGLLESVQTIPSCKGLQRVQRFAKGIDTKKLWTKLYSLLDMYDYSFFPENTAFIAKEPVVSNTKNKENNNVYSVSSTDVSNEYNNNTRSVYENKYNANNYTGVNNNANSVITQSSDPKSVRSHRTTRKNMRK